MLGLRDSGDEDESFLGSGGGASFLDDFLTAFTVYTVGYAVLPTPNPNILNMLIDCRSDSWPDANKLDLVWIYI
jgi:hypothetical protein